MHRDWFLGFQEVERIKAHSREGGRGTVGMQYPVLGGKRVKRVKG